MGICCQQAKNGFQDLSDFKLATSTLMLFQNTFPVRKWNKFCRAQPEKGHLRPTSKERRRKGVNLELIATKDFFADFTPTRPLEHHIKNVSKSNFVKLMKIVVVKHRVLHLHGNEAENKLLIFTSICNKNITEKLSTNRTELFNKHYFKF